ncbi:TIM barrel protein [Micrococcus luteus]|uniref:TIM barrel protein n=1 Tax=Micrococcus luteus TaxID=1270 RepID=UPI001472978B|nr:TIM barrel protein [Micrococcus luteus]
MKLAYHSITWGGVIGDPTGVTSIKDLYYRSAGTVTDSFAPIQQAGYSGVEMFEGNLHDFSSNLGELQSRLSDHELELVSVYTGGSFIYGDALEDELHKVRSTAELAAAAGAGHLVLGGGAIRATGTREDDYKRLGGALDTVAEIAASNGLRACFHPHLGTIVQSPEQLETVFAETGIGFCPDTAHLAAGGGDPAEAVRRYSDRLTLVHLKDYDSASGRFLPLGDGELNFGDILDAVQEAHYDDWVVVELDYYDGDPAEAAQRSRQYLRGLGL